MPHHFADSGFKNPVHIQEDATPPQEAVNQNQELYLWLEMRYGPGYAQKMIDDLAYFIAETTAA